MVRTNSHNFLRRRKNFKTGMACFGGKGEEGYQVMDTLWIVMDTTGATEK